MAKTQPIWTTFNQALKHYQAGEHDRTEAICLKLIKRNPRHVPALSLLSELAAVKLDFEKAFHYVNRVLERRPDDPMSYHFLAQVHNLKLEPDVALDTWDRGLALDPEHLDCVTGKSACLQMLGREDEAQELLDRLLKKGVKDSALSITAVKLALGRREYDYAVQIAEEYVELSEVKDHRAVLLNLKGRGHEKAGRIDEAFAAYEASNELVKVQYYPPENTKRTNDLISIFSARMLKALPRATNESEVPLLIVGMPRTGTSLLERIISMHPEARGAGELTVIPQIRQQLGFKLDSYSEYPRCVLDMWTEAADELAEPYLKVLEEFGRGAQRVVDKLPHNYLNLGLISILLPKARVIHIQRDPVNTCFSCYVANLKSIWHPYSTDLRWAGHAYREYVRLMAHWREVLPLPMLEIHYEDLVTDQESMTRQIIGFCGLPWDDACLRHHEAKEVTFTLSNEQVREPVYRTSIDRAAKFRSHLDPLYEALGDLA